MDREEFEALVKNDVDCKIEEEADEQNVVDDEPDEVEQEIEQETKSSYKECLECAAKVQNYCQRERVRERKGTFRITTSCQPQNMGFVEAREKEKQRRITDFYVKK